MQARHLSRQRARFVAALRRFGADRSAVAAVEFATVSPFFFALVVVTVMTGIIYMARSQLDLATQLGYRSVMVGETTNSGQLSNVICNGIGGLFSCSGLMISINSYASFSALQTANGTSTPTLNYNGSGAVSNTWSANFGTPGSIMVLQVMYQFPMIGASLFNFGTQANGTDLLISTAVFINE